MDTDGSDVRAHRQDMASILPAAEAEEKRRAKGGGRGAGGKGAGVRGTHHTHLNPEHILLRAPQP